MADKTNFLISALTKEDICEAEQLLKLGADPNHVLEDQSVSPMHIAAGLGLKYVCLLLQYGGDPNVRILDGTRPLHVSAVWGYDDAVQILLANGADPFLRDEDGLSPIDLARQGEHRAVVHFLDHYVYILATSDEQTITPKFTYKRLDGGDVSQRSLSPILDEETSWSLDNTQRDLKDFTRRRRSSVYLHSVQRQVDQVFSQDQRTHMLDVTSPDHPYIEPKHSREIDECSPENSPTEPRYHGSSAEASLHLHLSVSDMDESNSDSFVTCDGEDLETMLQRSTLLSSPSDTELSDSTDCPQTVVKRKFFPSLHASNSSQVSQSDRRSPVLHSNIGSSVVQSNRASAAAAVTNYMCNNAVSGNAVKDKDISKAVSSKIDRNLTVKKQDEDSLYEHDGRSECRRGHAKYCKRQSLFSELSDVSQTQHECDYCGIKMTATSMRDESVCLQCKKLGLELDELPAREESMSKIEGRTSRVNGEMTKPAQKEIVNENLKMDTGKLDFRKTEYSVKGMISVKGTRDKEKLRDGVKVCEPALDESVISLISYDGNSNDGNCDKAEFHESDFSTITFPEDYDPLNNSFANWFGNSKKTKEVKTKPSLTDRQNRVSAFCNNEKTTFPNEKGDREVKTCTFGGSNKTKTPSQKPSTDSQAGYKNQQYDVRDLNNWESPRTISPEVNDLWAEVRLSNQKDRKWKARKNVLDTAFCGRESVNSVWSDASTVDYIYTDTENSIALVEHHIPSQCGSTGSRRSLDSLFSVSINNCSQGEINPKDLSFSITSQDTVTYEWREHAMVRSPLDVEDSKEPTDEDLGSISSDLLKLPNDTIRSKLCNIGDDPGPVTTTTRQMYLRRLSSLQKDPDQKLLSRNSAEYPPEMTLALKGNLDLSEMAELETKMMAAFQNPSRLRRWREGTLKSSFTYILLDPRITKDLPNRSLTMNNLDIFKEFIAAIFYIGKGKRARPYCHLYEAIKQMKQPKDKVSQKVQHILDIWAGGLGVVSLHCFQSVIPVEAYTREACMVDALGLKQLTNMKKGDYYGVSTTFSMKQRRTMGVYLLTKSLQIFLAEGERQISPIDIKN